MQFFPKEPDIETLCKRIEDGLIDLQPDFQRGEVWSVKKKQRLIDTLLRGWIVPPVLLVRSDKGPLQVLDGQQRLAAIRDFKKDLFVVDGRIEPLKPHIKSLHGKRFSELPKELRDDLDNTALRVYEIAHYAPEEPAEIFFRLNQPAVLTSAEKRNAFFGPVRDVVRGIVEDLKDMPMFMKAIGFSNSRMAYDDVVARAAYLLEAKSLRPKVAEQAITAMYRRSEPLSGNDLAWLTRSVKAASAAVTACYRPINNDNNFVIKHNKATFFSWIIFFARMNPGANTERVHQFLEHFESIRQGLFTDLELEERYPFSNSVHSSLLLIYSDRATSRVSDVSSVLLRDFVLWYSWSVFSNDSDSSCTDPVFSELSTFDVASKPSMDSATSNLEIIEHTALRFIDRIGWGTRIQHARG